MLNRLNNNSGKAENLTFSIGKTMRRSLSVSIGRVTQKHKEDGGPSSARENDDSRGSVPENLVDMLLLLQVDTQMNIPSLISVCNPPEITELSKCIMTVYSHEDNLHMDRLLQWAYRRHLNDCHAKGGETLFRGTSLETIILSAYLHRECEAFLTAVTEPFFQWLCGEEGTAASLEVDPAKENYSDKNRAVLLEAASKLLGSLCSNVHLIPLKVCDLLKSIRGAVELKHPQMADRSVASLLVLRLLNPVLVTPEQFLAGKKELSRSQRRASTLVSKVIQNLANGVLFGEKEEWLVYANGWLQKSSAAFAAFIFDCVYAIRQPAYKSKYLAPSLGQVIESVRWIHNFFCARRKAILEKHIPAFFKGIDGKKNSAQFVSQLRRATNNFKWVAQDDMPSEWIKELGLDKNIFQRSINKVKEGVRNRQQQQQQQQMQMQQTHLLSSKEGGEKGEDATHLDSFKSNHNNNDDNNDNNNDGETRLLQRGDSFVIGAPVLVQSEKVRDIKYYQSPGKSSLSSLSSLSSSSSGVIITPSSNSNVLITPQNIPMPPLRRGKSATVALRHKVTRHSAQSAFDAPYNPNNSAKVRSREEKEEDEGEEKKMVGETDVIPMDLGTPDQQQDQSPLKKHKWSRDSIGELTSYTPTKRK